MAIVIVSF